MATACQNSDATNNQGKNDLAASTTREEAVDKYPGRTFGTGTGDGEGGRSVGCAEGCAEGGSCGGRGCGENKLIGDASIGEFG